MQKDQKLKIPTHHLDMMYAALIAKKGDTSYRKSIKFSEIALIFVNSLTDAILKIEKMEVLSGKLYLNSKSMPYMTVLNLDVIFAIRKSSNI